MTVRTLHCGKNIDNFNLCLDNQVAGFTHRGPEPGDVIYLLVRKGKKTECGARFVLDYITDEKPWEDSDKYVVSFFIKDIEFSRLFDISFLKEDGGEYWTLKYLQASKAIDNKAAKHLESEFEKHKTVERQHIKADVAIGALQQDDSVDNEEFTEAQESEIEQNVPDAKINIMGTFQTINFVNESDQFKGLEKLVTQNFFNLFPEYKEENTILISKNRLFKTQLRNVTTTGVSAIPDALLITFWPEKGNKIQISMVEYECYGEGKSKSSQRSYYMNTHIIPQLMQFASSFSIITDQQTRNNTINNWIDKIIEQASSSKEVEEKIVTWVKQAIPNVSQISIMRQFTKMLEDAFRSALRVFLIIDDLSAEQKETINNIISSFVLESNKNVVFKSSIVKLVQKINLVNEDYEYGLTVK